MASSNCFVVSCETSSSSDPISKYVPDVRAKCSISQFTVRFKAEVGPVSKGATRSHNKAPQPHSQLGIRSTKRIAVMCRRAGQAVKNRGAYIVMRDDRMVQKPRERAAELYQSARFFELLPQQPSDLWQMDVAYVHIPGYGGWYGVTVIDYYSRYLLASYLTFSYSATQVMYALKLACEEAEQIVGLLAKRPFLVTDNGPSFIARRFADFVRELQSHV